MNKLEAVIICVNYSDFLSISLEKNYSYFDNIVIVTNEEDVKTQNLSSKYNNITLIKTNAFNFNNSKFNKGMAINVGFSQLKYKDWVITLDADIILPIDFREKFLKEAIDKNCSYSSRRYNVPTFNEWKDIESGNDKIENKLLYRGIGYGNFFCFNYNSKIFQELLMKTNGYPYPWWIGNVSESDWIFRNYWSDWVYDPKLDDSPNLHTINNNDRPANELNLKQLSFNVIHLGQTGINAEERKSELWEQ